MNYELDVKAFWEENEKCFDAFNTNKPRVPISFWLDDHFLLEDMKLPSTLRYYNDQPYRIQIHKEINDKTDKVIGKRFYSEEEPLFLTPMRFEVIMGAFWKLTEGGTPWLESSITDIEDVKNLINKVQKLDMKVAAFPEGWKEEKVRYEKVMGKKVKLNVNSSRGPATMATSILGTTNTCMFIMDEPEVMDEFFEILGLKLAEYQNVLMKDMEYDIKEGYNIADDNCYLFPPKQYLRYCAPVLKRLFDEFAPLSQHNRFQHSDSSMGHLMGILYDLGVNNVNLGPSINIKEIRKTMPKAIIQGQIAPFILRNGSAEDIIKTVRYDIESVGQDGGLIECPAGSIAGGTSLENIKIYMWAVDTFGRY